MKIGIVNMGEMLTNVSPTVKALKKNQTKTQQNWEGEVQALSEWIAQQILFV